MDHILLRYTNFINEDCDPGRHGFSDNPGTKPRSDSTASHKSNANFAVPDPSFGAPSDYGQNDMSSMYGGGGGGGGGAQVKNEPPVAPIPVTLSNGYPHVYSQAASMHQVQNYMVQSQPSLAMQPLQTTTYVASPGGTSITATTMAPNSYNGYMTVYPAAPAMADPQPIYTTAGQPMAAYNAVDAQAQAATTSNAATASSAVVVTAAHTAPQPVPSLEQMKEAGPHPLNILSQSISPPLPMKSMASDAGSQPPVPDPSATAPSEAASVAGGRSNRPLNINVAAANADTSTPLPTFAKKLGELPPTGHRSPHILKKPAGLSVQIPDRPNSGSHLASGSNSVAEMHLDSPASEALDAAAAAAADAEGQTGRGRQNSVSHRFAGLARASDLPTTAGSDAPDRLATIGLAHDEDAKKPQNVRDASSVSHDAGSINPLQHSFYESLGRQDQEKLDADTATVVKTEEISSISLLSSAGTSAATGSSATAAAGPSSAAQDGSLASALPSKFARDLPSPSAFYREIYQQNNDVPSPFPSFNTPTPKSGTGGSFHWPAPMARGGSGAGGNLGGGGGGVGGNSGGSGSSTVVHHPSPLKQADSVASMANPRPHDPAHP
ncbi:hypothetical protein SYNPS1DRAFT_24930 [Syncephalis pseudoplumigaleata]|uniref:Uncharacterized protein n=1 Tax=Syncephalis pseudoplumigaleata TaxID=1712513 RepID=A0A4P9YTG6_9FUNG|nr:hypothetical protein SYNPS1DRAFT_24930 [Syncephalis pseudoplumigaleata]|eukprot:RKP23094.1 hypothetical protein SYNPS1DRAFT_24930 [Syncephalis pseudoplumigaleata]